MRKRFAAVFAVVFLLLSGCSGQDSGMQQALDLRRALLSRESYGFSMEATCDYGETLFSFSADCVTQDDGVRITLSAPETVAGIELFCGAEDAGIVFSDTLVSLGELADGRLIPLQAPYLLRRALESEYISCTGRQGELLRITYLLGYDDEEVQLDVLLDETGERPMQAEFTYEGRSVLRATVTGLQIGEVQNGSHK